jgi:hypothetical protein
MKISDPNTQQLVSEAPYRKTIVPTYFDRLSWSTASFQATTGNLNKLVHVQHLGNQESSPVSA